MQKMGFGACENREAWIAFPAMRERDCGDFALAVDSVIERRKLWIEKVNKVLDKSRE